MKPRKLSGNVLLAAFFGAANTRERRELRRWHASKLRSWRAGQTSDGEILALREGLGEVRPFHWELEFPEVFGREQGGFDAIVGNPPFLGGKRTTTVLGAGYRDWLSAAFPESSSNGDLAAFFFRRAFLLLRESGTLGFIATNTISQGDTRETGLRWICINGGTIYSAEKRLKWPGAAAVTVSVIHFIRGSYRGQLRLNGAEVPIITAFLSHAGGHESPVRLRENKDLSFNGNLVLGMGFTFDDTDQKGVASSFAEMDRLIAKDPRNSEVIFPYIGGAEVCRSPTQSHHRYVINFGSMSEVKARQWPDLFAIVEEKVKPLRVKQKRKNLREKYWVHAETRPALANAISEANKWWQHSMYRPALMEVKENLFRVLVASRVSTHVSFAFLSSSMVYSDATYVFPIATNAAFCSLQSRPHEIWTRTFASSLKDNLRYTATDCFETFPFPRDWRTAPALEIAGERYYEFRAGLMIRNNEGLTATYNRFHDPEETSPEIATLRELHAAMDRAVLDAYGWDDISTRCDFFLEYQLSTEDAARRKKKPWRYRWPQETHDEVLARLLKLNTERSD